MTQKQNSAKTEGLICPVCGYFESKVCDTRRRKNYFRRTRECLKCGYVFCTKEYIELLESCIYVEKDDGKVQKVTFSKIDGIIGKYMTDGREFTIVSQSVRTWLLNFYAEKKGKEIIYKLAPVMTIPIYELKKLIMAAISNINANIATNFYLKEISSQTQKGQLEQLSELSNVLKEIEVYATELKGE